MRMGQKQILDGLVTASASELFQSRGIELRTTEMLEPAIEYAAVIGFATDEMRGMLGLGMSPDTLNKLTLEDRASAGIAVSPEDWLGESVNQLMGRLRNKLLAYGVSVG